ncbi:MAG TPA: hypothetical protein PLS10_08295 [Chitinophagales bacterium]|nr:hypothetical protein [Chitinophagales bacterium]
MKKVLFILLNLFIMNNTIYGAENPKIISTIEVETDYIYEGAKGLNIKYKYSFLPLEEQNHNDTILKDASFGINTTFLENGNAIKPAAGYQSLLNENGDVSVNFTFFGSELDASKFYKLKSVFIPYSALNLPEGNHVISVKGIFSGTDGAGVKHQQVIQKDNINFYKPKTNLFTLNIDYVEANILNAKGQAWDYAILRTDAPDVGINVLVGNASVWSSHVNDTYMFSVGPNSKNITFLISEKDNVNILVQDIDILFHDFIAKWVFTTADKKPGTLYSYNKSKGNIKSCNLTFKID